MNTILEFFSSTPNEAKSTGDKNDNNKDLEKITREIFMNTYGNPAFKTPFGFRYMINADATASGFFYKPIDNYINRSVIPYYNNTHSNSFSGQMMSYLIAKSKKQIATSVNARDTDKILMTGNGCTGAIQHIIHLLNLKDSNQKAVVFISEAEHHSNDLPWRHLPITLIVIPIDKSSGLIRLDILKEYLKKYSDTPLKLISFIGVSNITGVIQPLDEISIIGHKYGALVMFDMATGGPYIKIDMNKDKKRGNYIDILVFSPHKFLGGPNTPGLLIFSEKCCKNDLPFCPGGGTVRFVTEDMQKYSDDIETRENGGTPNIVGCIKVGLCFALKDSYQDFISKREQWIVRYVQNKLQLLGDLIEIINPLDNIERIPIFSFRIKHLHYNLIVVLLNDLFGIQSRGGISCCSMYAQKILDIDDKKKESIYKSIIENKGVPSYYGWCRITFHYSMPKYTIDYIISAIEYIAKNFRLFKKYYLYDTKKNNWYFSDMDNPTTRDKLLKTLVNETLGTNSSFSLTNISLANSNYPTKDDLNSILKENEKLIQ
jgi:selenocysteine lyase/cysteine desulfurase